MYRFVKNFIRAFVIILIILWMYGEGASISYAYINEIDGILKNIPEMLKKDDTGKVYYKEALKKVKEDSFNLGLWKSTLPAYVFLTSIDGTVQKSTQLVDILEDVYDLCPDCPEILYRAGRMGLKSGFSGIIFSIGAFLKGWMYNFIYSIKRLLPLSDISKYLQISILFSLLFILLVDFLFHLNSFVHFLRDWLKIKANKLSALFFGVVVLSLPVAFGFGLDTTVFILLIFSLLWSIPSKKSFILTVGFFMLLLSFLNYLYFSGKDFISDERIIASMKYENYQWDDELIKELKKLEVEDPAFRRMRGIIYLKAGRMPEALSIFQSLIDEKKANEKDFLNLGVAQIGLNMQSESLKTFNKVVNKSPSMCSPHYNISQYYYMKTIASKGEEELEIARKLCESRVSFMTKIFDKNSIPRSYMIEEDTGFSYFKIFAEKLSKNLKQLFRPTSLYSSGIIANLICVFFLILNVRKVSSKFETSPVVSKCNNCGTPYCSNCLEVGSEEEGYCNTCYTIFIKKIFPDIEIKTKKETQVQKYKRFINKLEKWGSLIPGFSHTLQGRIFSGFVLLTFFLFYIFLILMRNKLGFGFIPHSLYITPGTVICSILLLLIYIITLLSAIRGRG